MRRLLFYFLFTTLTGLNAAAQSTTDSNLVRAYKRMYYSEELGFDVPGKSNFTLYDTVTTWIGTPYLFAGSCEKGIDCSGFVNILFDRVYGIHIGARNSSDIYKLVQKVDPDELHEGDLVFFHIHSRTRISHVGFYLGNNKFVHASTSRGVMISDLNDPYYKKYFAGAGRHHLMIKDETVQNPGE